MKFYRHKETPLYQHAFHVYRDWTAWLVVVVVLATASIVFHGYLFHTIQTGEETNLSEPTTQLTVKRGEMRDVIDTYTELNRQFELKKQGTVPIVDPSL